MNPAIFEPGWSSRSLLFKATSMKPTLRTRPLRSILWALILLLPEAGIVAADSKVVKSRDPFYPLPETPIEKPSSSPAKSPVSRPPGLKGTLISETSLVGIVSSGEFYLALLETEDEVTYIAKVGSRLFDGKVILISDNGVLFSRAGSKSNRSFKDFRTIGKEARP